jgi:hypothetical protein
MTNEHFYSSWQSTLYTKHLAQFCNMLHQTFMWINGRALNQLETQLPEVTVMDFGIAGTLCEPLIRERLKILNGQQDA